MPVFFHEKLILYQKALSFAVRVDELVLALPRERWYLKNQLWRCSASIPFNIAEGSGGQSAKTRINYFRIARGSAAESSSIFDYIKMLRLLPEHDLLYDDVRELGTMLGAAIGKAPR